MKTLILFLMISLVGCTSSVKSANNDDNEITNITPKNIPIKIKAINFKELVDKDFLAGCNFKSPYIIDLYMSYGYPPKHSFDVTNGTLYINNLNKGASGYEQLIISGFTSMHSFKRTSNQYKENIIAFDTDIIKYDMRIIQFALNGVYDYSLGSDFAGYFYVVEGLPSKNEIKLKEMMVETGYYDIETTENGNTRVRCSFF